MKANEVKRICDMSSYQRLKKKYEAERQSLINDIFLLVEHENDQSGLMVKAAWQIKFDINRAMWIGESTIEPPMIKQECAVCGKKFEGTVKIEVCPTCYV